MIEIKGKFNTAKVFTDNLESERKYLKKALWLSRAERARLEIHRAYPYEWSIESCKCWEKAVQLFTKKARDVDNGER